MDYKLTYFALLDSDLFTIYCNASYGDCKDSGHSTSSYVMLLENRAIGWSSKLQSFVTLSTTKAEYITAVEVGKKIMWICNMQYLA